MAYDGGKVRWRLMDRACDIARSGQHADHRSIVAQIQVDPNFARVRRWIESPSFLAQLDRLCGLARRQRA
jgi:hypothetical protein